MVFVSKLSNTLIHYIKFISIGISSHSGSLRTNCSLVRSVVGAISHTIVGLSQYVIIRVINMKLSQKLDTVLGQLWIGPWSEPRIFWMIASCESAAIKVRYFFHMEIYRTPKVSIWKQKFPYGKKVSIWKQNSSIFFHMEALSQLLWSSQ